MFAGLLLLFHSYLLLVNITTKEIMERKSCIYLKDIKHNPFDKGILENLKIAFFPVENGRYITYYVDNGSYISQIWKTLKSVAGCKKYGRMIGINVVES